MIVLCHKLYSYRNPPLSDKECRAVSLSFINASSLVVGLDPSSHTRVPHKNES